MEPSGHITSEGSPLPSRRQRQSKAMKLRWQDPAHRARVKAGFGGLEDEFARSLDVAGIDYERQVKVGRYVVDFVIEGRVVVEVQGCFWHSCEQCGHEDRGIRAWDRRRLAACRAAGYVPVEIWEHEIRGRPMGSGAKP